jgi:YidC/Oxa1 family membrane protein insertase
MDSLENDQHRQRMQMFIIVSVIAYFFWFSMVVPPPVQQNTVDSVVTSEEDIKKPIDKPNKVEDQIIEKEIEDVPSSIIQKVPFSELEFSDEQILANITTKDGGMTSIYLLNFSILPEIISWWGWIFDGMKDSWIPYEGGDEKLSILSNEGALAAVGRGDSVVRDVYSLTNDNGRIVAKTQLDGLVITKTFTKIESDEIASPFMYDISIDIKNNTKETVSDVWVGVFDKMIGEAGRFSNDSRPQFHVEDELYGTFGTMFSTSFLSVEDLEEDTIVEKEPVWFGIGSRYFLVALQASNPNVFRSVSTKMIDQEIFGSVAFIDNGIDPGATRNIQLRAFIGPKQLDILETLGEEWTDAVEFGIFGFFSKILLFLLKWIQIGFTNWGVSILLLTFIVKVIFFPLTQKAFMSGKMMQALQPQLKELKEKYKDNSQLQAQETMKLFQEHGVSPLGGCLPTVIQIPVWFSLYNVMLYSVELYDSSFLYLQDLTSIDPYGGLPVMYCALMFIQQRMMPMANMDPTQQQVLKMMPFLFGIFMFTFPSGLVLYFSMNILLTIFQQWLIRIQFDEKKLLNNTLVKEKI